MIPISYSDRIDEIMNLSWKIFKSQFLNGRLEINKEAPFQHHFANIIRDMGNLYCIRRGEIFFTDLETKCEDLKEKNKYLDITCGFIRGNKEYKVSVELKFKTARQGAQDHGRIDAYIDIEALELTLDKGFEKGFFFMITDSQVYVNPSRRGVGIVFITHNGFVSEPKDYKVKSCKGRENIVVNLKNSYHFNWEKEKDFYFLKLPVNTKLNS